MLIIAGLAAWTISSPKPMSLQSPGQLQTGIFSFSKSQIALNTSDGSGSYSFRFGLDYDSNVSAGTQTVFKVYVVLVGEKITSFFTRAVSMDVTSALVLIDGTDDAGVKTSSAINGGILTESLENPNTSLAAGSHNLTVRLIVSTIDLNYVGYSTGPSQVAELSGLFNITGS
jgi:hypothetical protein